MLLYIISAAIYGKHVIIVFANSLAINIRLKVIPCSYVYTMSQKIPTVLL